MPQIQLISSNARAATPNLPVPPADAFGAAAGTGLANFGETLVQIDTKLQDQQNRLDLVTHASNFEREVADMKQGTMTATDAEGKPLSMPEKQQLFLENYKQIRDTYADNENTQGLNRHVSNALRVHMTEAFTRDSLDFAAGLRKVEISKQRAETEDGVKEQVNAAAAEDDPKKVREYLERAAGLMQAGEQNQIFTPEEAQTQRRVAVDHFYEQLAIRHPDRILDIHNEVVKGQGPGRPSIIPGLPPMDPTRLPYYTNLANLTLNGLDQERIRAEKLAAQQLKLAQMATQNAFIEKITKNELTTREVLLSNLDPVGEGSKEHYIHLMQLRNKETTEKDKQVFKDPATFLATLNDIRRGRITTEAEVERVYAESVARGHGIDWEDTVRLRTEVDDLRTPEGNKLGQQKQNFLAGVKASIDKSNPMMGVIDHDGLLNFSEFSNFVDKTVNDYRQAKKDPHALFDPKSPDYLAAPDRLAPFQKTLKQSLDDMTRKLRQTPPPPSTVGPRKEGETPEQYLQRTEKP